jgi:hypothetical protein
MKSGAGSIRSDATLREALEFLAVRGVIEAPVIDGLFCEIPDQGTLEARREAGSINRSSRGTTAEPTRFPF